MDQIRVLEYEVEDEFPFDDVDEQIKIEAINVLIEDELSLIHI